MTVAPGARLRQLAEAVEEHRNGPHWWGHAERTLHNLAPSLAVLCADMADALEEIEGAGHYDTCSVALSPDAGYDCDCCWEIASTALARFRALTQETT